MYYYNNSFYKIVQYSIIHKYDISFLCKSYNFHVFSFWALNCIIVLLNVFIIKESDYGYIFSFRY